MAIRDKRNRRRAAIVLGLALVLGGLVWRASLRVGEEPAAGTTIQGASNPAAAAQHKTFRVATFNIHGLKGRDRRRDLERTAACLTKVDLAGLNEVHGGGLFRHGDQAELLGRALGLAWLYAPAERRWYVQQFGNGLLVRLPVKSWQRIPLPRVDDASHRNVVLVEVEHRGQPIRVLLTHLTERQPRDREVQLGAVIRLFLALEPPVVLLGDLNARADDPRIQDLLRQPGVEEVIAAHAPAPPASRVDWIFTRGLACRAAGLIDQGASDHPLFWADLTSQTRKSPSSLLKK